jgi:dienelactone hydrolase
MIDSKAHYQRLYEAVRGKYAFHAATKAAMVKWQVEFRTALRDALGLTRLHDDLHGHEARVELITRENLDGYIRERWHIEVEPGLVLPFFVLLPEKEEGIRPLVLCPHGHNPPHIYVGLYDNEAEHGSIIEGERDIAVQAVREGYIVIAPTTRGFGDTRSKEDEAAQKISSCRTQLMHGLLLGRTPIGERVWDIGRLLDWAMDNLNVDPARIAITGNSGGGTVSLYAAACDERIAVAVPSCYFCTFAGSIGSIPHCDCNYVPGILRLGEMWDVAGLIAPRPFCAIAGQNDEIFPIAEVRKAYQELRRIYEVAGAPANCRLYVGDGGHRFYKAGAWPFIREHFAGTAHNH